jgi:hypothetical protein
MRFRRDRKDFPQRDAYLAADPGGRHHWRQVLADLEPGLKVGIAWRGGLPTTRSATRSIPLIKWLPLLRTPGAVFISLQHGDCQEEIAAVREGRKARILHWEAAIEDYDATAALVSELDIVVSVQTAIVHLAGALGTPVWVLIPQVSEWRYGQSGESMPWYQAARLFRQQSAEDWDAVIARVQVELSRLSADTQRGHTCR